MLNCLFEDVDTYEFYAFAFQTKNRAEANFDGLPVNVRNWRKN